MEEHLSADRKSMIQFLKGESQVKGKFWLVNLLRFKPGGAEEYQRYADGIKEPMAAVGARPIFASYTAFTVVDGAGAVFPVDGVFIGEYPSPSALVEMNKSPAYQEAHKHRAAALAETAMYAIPAGWGGGNDTRLEARKPDPSIKAPACEKSAKQLEAINGNPERFMTFIQDDRFDGDSKNPPQVWMLNFLQYEPGEGRALYEEYGLRANSHISSMEKSTAGKGGGLALAKNAVHVLRGPRFDTVAIMKYPSRSAFLTYAMGQGTPKKGTGVGTGGGNELVAEGFKLRQAGLAVQGLVCMLPERLYDAEGQSRL